MSKFTSKQKMVGILIALFITALAITAYVPIARATTLRVVQTPTIYLYTGQNTSQTTMRITPYPKDLNGVKLTITDFGDNPTVTVDPKISGIEEIEGFAGITDNGDGTATLTGITRNLNSKYPYTTGGTGRTHGAGAAVVFGNNPQLYGRLAAWENTGTTSAIWYFGSTTPPRYDWNPNFTTLASTTLASIGYVASTSYSGTVDATETVKGIVELATQIEMASSTSAGSTGALLVLPASYATSSPGSAGLWAVITNNLGKIAQTFFDLTTAYSWTGLHTFTNATSTNQSVYENLYIGTSATSTFQGSTTGTSTLQGFLNILGTNSTSTFSGNASTTNFQISGVCIGCPMTYTASSTGLSTSGDLTFTGSIPTNATVGVASYSVTQDGKTESAGTLTIMRIGNTSASVIAYSDAETNNCNYSITWTGSNLVVDETDTDGDCLLSGTMYWYK